MEESATQLLESTGSSRSGNRRRPCGCNTNWHFRTCGTAAESPCRSVPLTALALRGGRRRYSVFLLSLYLRLQPDADESANVYARMPVPRRAAAVAPSSPSPEPVSEAVPQTLPTKGVPEPGLSTSASSVREPTISAPGRQPRQRFRRKALPMCQRLYLPRSAWRPSFDSLVSFTLSRVLLRS